MKHVASTTNITLAVCLAMMILAGGFFYLVLAKPHWSSTLYRMNYIVIKDHPPRIPDGFTGTWRRWDKDGALIYKAKYKDRWPVGIEYSWWSDGSKKSEQLSDGGEVQWSKEWYPQDAKGHSQLRMDLVMTSDPTRGILYYSNGQKEKEIIRSKSDGYVTTRKWDQKGILVSETK